MSLSKTIVLTFGALASALAAPHSPVEPSHEAAKDNAYRIFNAIHSAGRQWGSSLNHNGFSFFPAVMPKGTLTYHGARTPDPPTNPEWLAFEVEHAENFALSFRYRGSFPNVTEPGDDDDDDEVKIMRGYLHTYRANRDLNLLYVDGMSAGKTDMGTLDSQDLVLRGNHTKGDGIFEEWDRAVDLCDIVTAWGFDGIMRDEIGFEVIHCDFSNGLDLISATRTYLMEDKVGGGRDMRAFQWTRAVAERYHDIGGDRLRIDFSSMVSGFFFPINVSSTNPDRPDLIRLAAASLSELKDIKTHLHEVTTQPRRFNVNWQALVDMITTRFGERFALMGSDTVTASWFVDELEAATLLYVNAPPLPDEETMVSANDHEKLNETEEAIDRCSGHYLLPSLLQKEAWSLEDELIYTAICTVMKDICNNLFTMRMLFLELDLEEAGAYRINKGLDEDQLALVFEISKPMLQSLMEGLDWTMWKAVRRCPVGEIDFIAMWPFGSEEDHWHPACRSVENMADIRFGYWTDRDLGFNPDAPLVNDEL